MEQWRRVSPSLGWVRASGRVEQQFAASSLPAPIRERLVAIYLKSHMYRTTLREAEGFDADLALDRAPPSLGSLPLVVLSEGKPNIPYMQENLQMWFRLQEELARLSTNGVHIVATESARAIHRTEPQLVLSSIQRVIDAARASE